MSLLFQVLAMKRKTVFRMAKYKFYVGADFAAGAHFEEIVELPDDLTEKELQKEFEEWVFGQLDAYYKRVRG